MNFSHNALSVQQDSGWVGHEVTQARQQLFYGSLICFASIKDGVWHANVMNHFNQCWPCNQWVIGPFKSKGNHIQSAFVVFLVDILQGLALIHAVRTPRAKDLNQSNPVSMAVVGEAVTCGMIRQCESQG